MAQLGNVTALNFQPAIAALAPAPHGIEALFERQPFERFNPGETVFYEGDPAKHIFEIAEGVVRLCRILVDGRRIVTGFLFAGDVVGVSQRRHFGYSAEAVTPVRLRRVLRRSLDETIEASSELRARVFARLCEEMAAAQEQMTLLSCKTAEERVASFLAMLMKRSADRHFSPITIDLPMTRLDIADYLGLTIETVSRNLTKLAKQGLISNVERFSLRIVKPQALEELAGISDYADEDAFRAPVAARSTPAYRH